MAWNLAEFSKIETDVLRKSVIDGLLMESNCLELIPWETIGQLSTTIIRYQDLPSVGTRKISGSFDESTGHFEHKTENISLYGLDIDTDKAIARAKNTIADARAIQQTMALKSMAYRFNDDFIEGDPGVDPEEFKGVRLRIDDIYNEGFVTQKIGCHDDGGTAGYGILQSTTESHNILNALDKLMYAIKGHNPDFLFMNKKMLLAVRALLRKEKLLDNSKDMFDRKIDMYSGARLIDIGTKADQLTEIITNTEDAAGEASTSEHTSIYAVKFGIGEYLWGIQEYPLEVGDLGELQTKPSYRTRVDWPLGLADVDPRCIGRLVGIIPNSSS